MAGSPLKRARREGLLPRGLLLAETPSKLTLPPSAIPAVDLADLPTAAAQLIVRIEWGSRKAAERGDFSVQCSVDKWLYEQICEAMAVKAKPMRSARELLDYVRARLPELEARAALEDELQGQQNTEQPSDVPMGTQPVPAEPASSAQLIADESPRDVQSGSMCGDGTQATAQVAASGGAASEPASAEVSGSKPSDAASDHGTERDGLQTSGAGDSRVPPHDAATRSSRMRMRRS